MRPLFGGRPVAAATILAIVGAATAATPASAKSGPGWWIAGNVAHKLAEASRDFNKTHPHAIEKVVRQLQDCPAPVPSPGAPGPCAGEDRSAKGDISKGILSADIPGDDQDNRPSPPTGSYGRLLPSPPPND